MLHRPKSGGSKPYANTPPGSAAMLQKHLNAAHGVLARNQQFMQKKRELNEPPKPPATGTTGADHGKTASVPQSKE